jgi:hypothetical protein
MRNVRSAKNKTRYQNIPPRYQIRASVRRKIGKIDLTVPPRASVAYAGIRTGRALGR